MNKFIGLCFLLLSSSLIAQQNVIYTDTDETTLNIPIHHPTLSQKDIAISLPHIDYSDTAKAWFKQQLTQKSNSYAKTGFDGQLPAKVNLGMQGTPVLNQGRHGSCVTFAITGALNALLGAGDYISQLCSLELGAHLALNGQTKHSGWHGTYGHEVLGQIMKYGIISKNHQQLVGCAGVTEYPVDEKHNQGHAMPVSEYLQKNVPMANLMAWKSLLTESEAHSPDVDMLQMLYTVKSEIAKGHRVTVGAGLDSSRGHHGAMGQNYTTHDTWMITPEIIVDILNDKVHSGHHMIITGYDDDAVVYDDSGYVSNKGILVLRNSWSKFSGNQGNYYMTYDYFRYLVHNLNLIVLKT